MCNRLSPGQPYYTITTVEDAAGMVGVYPVTRPGDISGATDLVAVHVAARASCKRDLTEDRFASVPELLAAYPELDGTRTVDDGEGGTVERPIVLGHSYGTVCELG